MLILLNILSSLIASSLYFHALPSESTGINVRTACQDSLGNMWFGGKDGLVRFDNSRYTDFSHMTNDPGGPADDHIYRLFCDRDGKVWVAHLSGISIYDYNTGLFRHFASPDGLVRELCPLTENRVLTVVEQRLWLFDKDTGTFSREGIPASLKDLPFQTIYAPDDTLYIGGPGGKLYAATKDLRAVRRIPCHIGSSRINCLLKDGATLWIGTEGGGLWQISPDGTLLRHDDLGFVRTICPDEDGGLWIGTKNGLFILRDDRLESFHHDYYNTGSLTHDSVHTIFRDKQGTIWLGTFYGGVCYCTSHPSLFTGIVSRPGEQYLNGNIISDIVEDADGSLWIGTNSGGLNHLRGDGTFGHVKGQGGEDADPPDIKSICISPLSGKIFVGSDKGELSVLFPGGKRLQTLNNGLLNGSYAIESGPDGVIYIGTPDCLYAYDERSGELTEIPLPGTPSNISALKMDSGGTLWIGKKYGVAAILSGSGTARELPEGLAEIRYVEDFLEDDAGRIWISSSDGLICYSPSDGSLQTYTVADGLPDNVIHGAEKDASGRLWISTNRGLCRFDPATGEKWIFTTADGLPGDRFTAYAHCRTRSGEMYFGGTSWIVRFNPDAIAIYYKEVSPVISGMEVNGVWRPVIGDSAPLRPRDRDISIIFSAPDYLSGQNGHFFYKLERAGLNDTWHEAGLDRKASYHGLEKGSYTFRLRYHNSAGIRSPEERVFHFKIPPIWYETAIFRISILLVLSALVVFFVRRLLAKKKAEYQSEMEKVRNELLNEFSLEFVRIGANKADGDESSVAKVFYKGDEEFMRKAMQIVKKNLDNPDFSVEALAAELNMSRSTLHLRAKALFGVSSHEFIKTVRFNEACRLLLEKKHTVAEIGYMVGFTTPSYFASAFHRFMGCTPSEYVRQNGRG